MSAVLGSTARIAGLSASEIRVLGCLLEKQRTTPDVYPLSLNALRLACNQSTNREPVVEYDDATLRDALHRLERRGLVRLASGAGSRAAKYRHRLAEALPLDDAEQALMCVLMLRGAQTPGELKLRGERMHAFGALTEVHDTLERLIDRGLAARLERRPGHKEERYAQLLQAPAFGPDPDMEGHVAVAGRSDAVAYELANASPAPAPAGPAGSQSARDREAQAPERPRGGDTAVEQALRELSERVARLESELSELRGAGDPPGAVPAS
jgi:uncharacterized protein YceH (UPF0502 family)